MQFLQFKIFEGFQVKHGLSLRQGGVSKGYLASLNLSLMGGGGEKDDNIRENYRRFCEAIGVEMDKLVIGSQVHGDKILEIHEDGDFGFGKAIEGVDGFITNVVGLPLMVRFADCQAVLMLDPVKRVIAAVHSGWRGNAKNIIGGALKKMVVDFDCDAENILVGISASIGPCCASFSDPYSELPNEMHKYVVDGKVDLWKCSFDQIREAGVPVGNIEITRRCTVCENEVFFSHRAGMGKTGRMGAVIALI